MRSQDRALHYNASCGNQRVLDVTNMVDGVFVATFNPLLKKYLHDTQFSSENGIIESVEDLFKGQGELFYKIGIWRLQKE